MLRILCPAHQESTPSFVVYPDGWGHCFACGYHARVDATTASQAKPKLVEDVTAKIEEIKSLPTQEIRGLKLHANEQGYYILWPEGAYYKFRDSAATTAAGKYRCPSGVPKPIFHLRSGASKTPIAIVVEGEINALSIWEATHEYDVVCPGGAGDFYSKNVENWLPILEKRIMLLVWCDKDKAGALAAIKLKARLIQSCPNVKVVLSDEDANEILQAKGPAGLKAQIDEYMGLSARL